MDMAKMLVATMEEPWEPGNYQDDYLNKLQAVIDAKVKAGGKSTKRPAAASGSNVVDLMEALQQSLKAGAGKKKVPKPAARAV
jgi:DNA end-binding protein Ku